MPLKPPPSMSDFEARYRSWHTKLSYVKSVMRLVSAGAAALFYNEAAVAILILSLGFAAAEVVGILEEII